MQMKKYGVWVIGLSLLSLFVVASFSQEVTADEQAEKTRFQRPWSLNTDLFLSGQKPRYHHWLQMGTVHCTPLLSRAHN